MHHFKEVREELEKMEKRVKELTAQIAGKNETIQELKKTSKRSVHFDEAIIAEHDKERGTRMKIDEPKTPYVVEDPFQFPVEDEEAGHVRHIVGFGSVVDVPNIKVDNGRPMDLSEDETNDSDDIPLVSATVAEPPAQPRNEGAARPMKLDLQLLNTKLEKVQKKSDFESARSKHYNEFERLKQWRMKQKDSTDDTEASKLDDEDEDDEEAELGEDDQNDLELEDSSDGPDNA